MSKYHIQEDINMKSDLKEPLLSTTDSKTTIPVHKDTPFEKFCKRFWALFAIMAGIMFGCCNVLYDISAQSGLSAYRMFCLAGFGTIFYWVVYHLIVAISLYNQHGHFWSRKDSYYFKEDDTLDWEVVMLIGSRTGLSLCSTICIMLVFKTTADSGINSSVITSLFSGTVLATALAFFFVFHERVTKKHFLGMAFLILSVVLIANSPPSTGPVEVTQLDTTLETTTPTGSVLLPLIYCLCCCCIFAGSSIVARFIKHKRFPQYQYSGDCLIILSLSTTILALIEHLYYEPYQLYQAWGVATGSFFVIGAAMCLNCALAFGKAGPTQALTQLQSPFQLLVELIIYNKVPSTQGLIGMAIGLAGAIIIILWKN